MKRPILSATLCLLAAVASVDAAIVVPGANGTDGALNITQDTVIDLSRAATGSWDQDNTANAGNGVYDADKWAVVFKYTSVNILAGKKLTFKNHATRAPLVWLVSGNVTISGTVDLSGESASALGVSLGRLAEPGPGGFRGGADALGGDVLWSSGFGPGGGISSNDSRILGPVHGGYGTAGGTLENRYGNPSIIPLLGGSGGAGNPTYGFVAQGGAGGGAMLIASAGDISFVLGGNVRVVGGTGIQSQWVNSGHGSGGGVRLICSRLVGNGSVNAAGGGDGAGSGRIRFERVSNTANLNVAPAPSTIDIADGSTAMLWPPAGAPEARIVSVNQAVVSTDPAAAFGAYTPDVALGLVSNANVIVETVNVERASKIVVRITPRNGMTQSGTLRTYATEVNATIKEVVSEDPLKLRWQATLPTLPGHSAIQARVVRP